MNKIGIIIALIIGLGVSLLMLFDETKKRVIAESNNVALVQQYDSLKVRPLQMSANDFRELLPELADSIEALTGTKLKRLESLIMSRASISYTDYHYPVKTDTLTIHDTTYTGRSVTIQEACINQSIFIPDSIDTAVVDFDLQLKIAAFFKKERQNKFGKVKKWPFGKKRTVAELKVLCGETMIQDSIFSVQFNK